MAIEALSTAELARMLRQILNSEEKEAVEVRDPRFAFYDCYHVPWQESELLHCSAVQRGMVNCPVCGVVGGMGDVILCGHGAEAELRFEHLHVLDVHAGLVGGELILDIDRLRKVLRVGDVPLVEQVDEYLRGIVMALWEIQNAVISKHYLYSRGIHKKRREGSLTTWKDRTIREWIFDGYEGSQSFLMFEFDDWKQTLAISLAIGEACVDIPAQARHLMEVHGLTDYAGWQVWNHPGDYEKIADFLGMAN